MSLGQPEPFFIDEVASQLALPGALERWSLLGGEPWLVVDLRGDAAASMPEEARSAFAARLGQLPALTVAIVDDDTAERAQRAARAARATGAGGKSGSGLAGAFDLHVSAPRELTAVASTLERCPLASLGLLQLLRMSAALDLHSALVAESFVYSTLQSGPEFKRWLTRRERRSPRAAQAGAPVEIEREEARLRIALNRPEKRNAFSAAMRDALCEALQVAECDARIQVELSGRGKAFCAGGDLDEFGTLPNPATAHAIRSTRSAGRMLAGLSERTTALVHGACVGAGVELAAFAGHVAALDDAFFQLPELSLGLVPGAGGTASLPRRIGRQRTAWLALTGERIDATTALEWGLIDELAFS